MQLSLQEPAELEPLVDHVRPATIWLGIACFFLGSIGVGAVLAAHQFGGVSPEPAAAVALLSLGVAYVGIGLALSPTGARYDPEIEFSDRQRVLVAALAGSFFAVGAYAFVTLLV